MAEVIEIRSFKTGKKYRYYIRNIQSVDIQLNTPITATPLPESNDTRNVLTKAEGNTMRIQVSWVIHDDNNNCLEANNYDLQGKSVGGGTTPVPFQEYSSDTGFRLADHQVRFLLESNMSFTTYGAGSQVDSLDDVQQIVIGNLGLSRQGLIENIQLTKAGTSPVTWNATLSFIVGEVITA